MNSLPDEEYETFILTLINGKQTVNYSDVSSTLVNYEVWKKNKQSSSKSDSAEALTVRGRSFSKKGKSDRGRSKSGLSFRDLKKVQSALCKELKYWKIDYPRIKYKNKELKIRGKSRKCNQYQIR